MKIKVEQDTTLIYPDRFRTMEDIEYFKVYLNQLLENGYNKILICLSEIEHISLVCLGRLVEILKRISYYNDNLVIICDKPQIYRIITRFGITDVLPVEKHHRALMAS